jgi:hypothetical protein
MKNISVLQPEYHEDLDASCNILFYFKILDLLKEEPEYQEESTDNTAPYKAMYDYFGAELFTLNKKIHEGIE